MAKQILYNGEARRKLKIGMDLLTRAVTTTLGPRGRNVVFTRKFGKPVVTKDGVTVANQIALKDKFENIGVELLKKVAAKTGKEAGDGTTTSIIITHEIIQQGIKNLVAGANPMDLKIGIDKAIQSVVDSLKNMSKPINSNKKEIEFIATIAANNDKEVGALMAEAFFKVGKDGLITIEEGKGKESKLELKEGMHFDRGYLSPYFINNKLKMECILEKPYVLIYNKKIIDINEILHLLNECVEKNTSLLIISENIEGNALSTLIVNTLRGAIKIAAIKAPSFGENRKEILEDIAALSSGTVISEETGYNLKNTSLASLGRIDKAIISKDSTALILSKRGKNEKVKQRVKQINARLARKPKLYEKEKLEERKARLTGSIAVIRIGAATEIELKEKKDRFDDALKSTKAALEEGILPGGGISYIRCQKNLDNMKVLNPDQVTGISIIKKALEKPVRKIAENSGFDGTVVVDKIRESDDDFGFNALTFQYENLLISGIIDPTKVARIALQNAASIAGVFLTLECAIAEMQKTSQD